ncbi:DnaA ATPase domain-containing protein [Thermodesulfobacteriota bacterium]
MDARKDIGHDPIGYHQAGLPDGIVRPNISVVADSLSKSQGTFIIDDEIPMKLLTEKTLDQEMTFETFVQSEDNVLALETAKLVAREGRPWVTDGPFYLYGESGSGKSHILQAIINSLDGLKAVMLNLRDLEADFKRAREHGYTLALAKRLTEPDIVLLDDIHLCEGHRDFQRELFSIIYQRLGADRAVVVTSEFPPEQLAGFEPRLIALLGRGSNVPVYPGDATTRYSMFRELSGDWGLPDHVLEYLTVQIGGGGRGFKDMVGELTHAPRLQRLLYLLGYRLTDAKKEFIEDEPAIISQWRRESDGTTHVVDFSYLQQSREVLNRVWCSI